MTSTLIRMYYCAMNDSALILPIFAAADGASADSLDPIGVILSTWPNMLMGLALLVFAIVAGHSIARDPSLRFVRATRWWVHRVVLPLVRHPSGLVRAVSIFVNNASIMAVLVAVGVWPWAAIGVTGLVGVSMGVALRLLSGELLDFDPEQTELTPGDAALLRFGMGLNMLEPPAILASIGLGIGALAAGLDRADVWRSFVTGVLPLAGVAAIGEAMWLGATLRAVRKAPPGDGPDSAGGSEQSYRESDEH